MNKDKEVYLRRGTVVEDAAEGLLEEKELKEKEGKKNKKSFGQRCSSFGKSIYNHEYREFASRDGKDCCQLSFFYFIFYGLLSGFFMLMLLAFKATIDPKIPTYYDKTSVMNHVGVNPGLGFRPQYNPENNLINLNVSNSKVWKEEIVKSIDVFLDKYEEYKSDEIIINPLRPDRKVRFDYSQYINGTPCSRENDFGYKLSTPCVILKINRVYGWLPKPFEIPPSELKLNLSQQVLDDANSTKYLYISCEGENAFDKDNIGDIDYYSMFPSNEVGGVPVGFFPYANQPRYLSPLVFAHFKSLAKNTLINVRCRLWGRNVDNSDNLNQRGMAKFEMFVSS